MALKINKREKYAIGLAAGILALFIVIQFVVSPFLESRRRVRRQLEVQTRALAEIRALKAEFEAIKKRADDAKASMARRTRGFTLFSYLDTLAGKAGLKDRIAYMKPSTAVQEDSPYKIATVETKLQAVTMKQLVTYIYRIETSRNMVKLKRLSITKTGKQAGTVDAVLLVESFEI